MRTAIVGQPNSQLHGLKTRCCNRKTKAGQTVIWTLTAAHPGLSWRERAFVLHTTCVAEQIAAAPEGAPTRPADLAAELAALRSAAAAA